MNIYLKIMLSIFIIINYYLLYIFFVNKSFK